MISYWIFFCLFIALLLFLEKSGGIFRDSSNLLPTGGKKPFSLSRILLAWWVLIILPGFTAILIGTGFIPVLSSQMLVLLGVSGGTTLISRVVDAVDLQTAQAAGANPRSIDNPSAGFWKDILSDNGGINIHRVLSVLTNLIVGSWMIVTFCINLQHIPETPMQADANNLLPQIETATLVLLGISAGIYTTVKATENRA
ncbi:MAG: hypothetical protein FD123_1688 [Bacteroidetes bacterium]|nr:MAG: hypothetical protein FD123_1688 [Bacteroidota bacterium]